MLEYKKWKDTQTVQPQAANPVPSPVDTTLHQAGCQLKHITFAHGGRLEFTNTTTR